MIEEHKLSYPNICNKILTDSYLAFCYLKLQGFTILYFGYLQLSTSHHFLELLFLELFELISSF